jgi:hypothetical protein
MGPSLETICANGAPFVELAGVDFRRRSEKVETDTNHEVIRQLFSREGVLERRGGFHRLLFVAFQCP